VSNRYFSRAVDGNRSTAFSGTSILSPRNACNANIIKSQDHVRHNHRAVREFTAAGNAVSFESDIDPVKVARDVSDSEGSTVAVPRGCDDPVVTGGLDGALKGVAGSEALEGLAFLLLASGAAIPASIAPAVESISPGKDRLQDRSPDSALEILSPDEVEKHLVAVGLRVGGHQIVSRETFDFIGSRRIPAHIVQPPIKRVSNSRNVVDQPVLVVVNALLMLRKLVELSRGMMD